ncbi:smp protein [Pseudoalteromonas rubra]|uniref:Smp protein n=1 Tax=Pseudoalteromonas rubra TaxID=43658 RepID=A0A5S3WMQ9_9GAMM|nr:AhpA/YtjB family protein [Pseudoalteromonas rubra]TMP29333.1 smp protein [Pseudoalteromonas rubra]TMP34062.1 smp protein [Pseudoalteromonas rubra]
MKNTQALEYLSSSRNRRLLRLLVAAMCFLTVTWLAFNTSFRSHQLLHTNADHTGRSLTKQLALNAALPLSRMDTPQLRALCNHLASDEFVLSVRLYNQQGQFIIGNDGQDAPPEITDLPRHLAGLTQSKQPIVEPIYDTEQQPIGFVSVEYLTESAMAESHRHFHELGRVVLLMLAIACIFTWQIGRALKRWEVKRQIRNSVADEQ